MPPTALGLDHPLRCNRYPRLLGGRRTQTDPLGPTSGAGIEIQISRARSREGFDGFITTRPAGGGPFLQNGGGGSWAPSVNRGVKATAIYLDKALKGVKPAELPVQQPTKFELVINLKTASALALTIPYSVMAIADEVIA
jgi:ABC transporter substrate binding protein